MGLFMTVEGARSVAPGSNPARCQYLEQKEHSCSSGVGEEEPFLPDRSERCTGRVMGQKVMNGWCLASGGEIVGDKITCIAK